MDLTLPAFSERVGTPISYNNNTCYNDISHRAVSTVTTLKM